MSKVDITVLLRAADGYDFDSNLRADAADMIDRLRDALREIAAADIQFWVQTALMEAEPKAWRHMLEHIAQYDMQKVAIDALMEGNDAVD